MIQAQQWLAAGAVLAAYGSLCAAVVWNAGRKRARARQARAGFLADDGAAVLVAYASQTGFAEQLALATAQALQAGGAAARIAALSEVDAALLSRTARALFIVSTTGEGDAPDAAAGFLRRTLTAAPDLSNLTYGLLALGDSSYVHMCAFGRTLDRWLGERGAASLFERVEVDDGDPDALRHWRSQLTLLGAAADAPDWTRPQYGRWRLVERTLLNRRGDHPAWHVALEPLDGPCDWRAGDIAEIGPRNGAADVAALLQRLGLDGDAPVRTADGPALLAEALASLTLPAADAAAGLAPQALVDAQNPLPHREYSIASIASDGRLELLVREAARPDGRLGLGSGWLTRHAPPGTVIDLRVRTNRAFHGPGDDRPLILIGAGTGIAGLRAHLKARAAAGARRNWLLFGERTRAGDYFYGDEIEAWRTTGVIERLDLAFSRDADDGAYVQDRLDPTTLRAWVADGAAIYVCGGVAMGQAVTAALAQALGAEALAQLTETGRYRRDVY